MHSFTNSASTTQRVRSCVRGLLALACMFSSVGVAESQTTGMADTVLTGGKVWTVDPQHPEAEAIAVRGDRILAVGTSAEMMKLAGPSAKIIALNGRRVLPGFNDAHIHVPQGGGYLISVQLSDAKSKEEFRNLIAAFAAKRPRGEWILNGLWDEQRWSVPALPSHDLIDDVTPNNPVAVQRTDLHMLLANAAALRIAGVDKNTPDVPGGVIGRDAQGNPTGIFKDSAMALITDKIPADNDSTITRDVLAMQELAARNGITSVQEMAAFTSDSTGPVKMRVLQTLQSQGKLKVRVSECLGISLAKQMEDLGIQANFGNELFHFGCLKTISDGGLGASTAWFFDHYANNPQNFGTAADVLQDEAKLYQTFKAADAAGLQLVTHAIGDRANDVILNFYERVAKENGPRDRRFRIEHAQTLLPADISRFAKLHVIASMQPYHAIDDGRWAITRLGPERIKTTYAFRSLLDSGATLAFGSDWPVGPLRPMTGIYGAVTRRTIDGKNPEGWMPQEKITVQEAIKAYTFGSAYAEHEETLKGMIKPGLLADIIVLSDDILHIDPVKIDSVEVDMTILGGQIIYERTKK
jgi:predicted amidohydrolase YtcJ